MAVQTAIEQNVAQPRVQEDVFASHAMTEIVAQPQQGTQQPVAVQRAGQLSGTTVAVMGAAVLASVALFVVGILWYRLEPVVYRLMRRAGGIRIPLALPATIVEVARTARDARQVNRRSPRHAAPRTTE